jgi:hypothetical protein
MGKIAQGGCRVRVLRVDSVPDRVPLGSHRNFTCAPDEERVSVIDAMSAVRFTEILDRLGEKSIEDHYNPYLLFDWPECLPEQTFWMSQDLLSVHGTDLADELDRETMWRLSKWESINFYSLNVQGIRELLVEVVNRIHTPGFETPSAFFHHFLNEENQHMWFFAEFCRRYGGKIYRAAKLPSVGNDNVAVQHFLVFARILLFEEIVDFYNLRMAGDETLHSTIRQVNEIHHRDESRHIAFGRELVALLYQPLRERLSADERHDLEQYLKRYIVYSVHSFYDPQIYRDAGIPDPLEFRSRLLADERRRPLERKILRKPLSFLLKQGIFADDTLPGLGGSR